MEGIDDRVIAIMAFIAGSCFGFMICAILVAGKIDDIQNRR